MAEVEAIKDLDKVRLISHLLEIRCSKPVSYTHLTLPTNREV